MSNKKTATSSQVDPTTVGRDIKAEQLAATVSTEHQIEADDALLGLAATFNERGLASLPLTPEQVEDRVDGLVQASIGVFFEPTQRVLADNGKAYPLDWDFEGRDYGTEGEIVTRDRYDYLNKQVGRMICSGLEMILRNQDKAIDTRKDQITKEIRFGRNVGADVTAKVESMADFLAVMQEQRALIEIALRRAVEGFATAFGETYLTADARARQVAARKAEVADNGDLSAKLAKLGVNVE